VSEDEGQESTPDKPEASRPVTAAARRQRRASARRAAEGKHSAPETSRKGDTAASTDSSASAAADKKGKPTASRDTKVEKASLWSRLMRFLREVVAELRKVIWPTRKQMITYTSVVLVFLAVMTALVYGLDLGFTKLIFLVFA
jgi:preprotein translocase subunit SecE